MSEPLAVVTPKDTPRAPYAIQLDDTLVPEVVVPCTPEGEGPNAYKRIDDDIVLGVATGYWSTSLFGSFDSLVPNAFMATLCPCVSLAQISSRLGMVPFNTALLFFALLCSLELVVVALIIQQFVSVVMLGRDETFHYFHAHRVVEPRPAVNGMLVTVALLTHATLATALLALRTRIRAQFMIPGSTANDCTSVTCCPCFSTAQMASHIKSYRPGSCSFAPVDTLPRYQ
ncbi:PLAC8 family protein [Phytophthora cinnamomi]|uniref:PLAC8 family protein n=1 Tax=Phytophthora cinnamomi TaxID=4785 RepID=UPI00355A1A70|nr:PLAC8 family protein [Phytophthora cinnamomi]